MMEQGQQSHVFERAISCVEDRCLGLSHEFETIIAKWENLSDILMEKRVLPKVVKKYLNPEAAIDFDAIKRATEKLRSLYSANTSDTEGHLVVGMSGLDEMMEELDVRLDTITQLLDIIKISLYQRTDSTEIPYVIAGLPKSPERTLGKEFFMLAADELVRNYSSHLKMYNRNWDGFVSYYSEPRGGLYMSFRTFFHVSLSEDLKYFLPGFLVLAHELGHAACEARVADLGRGIFIPQPVYRFLRCLYRLKSRVWLEMTGLPRPASWNCANCTLFWELLEMRNIPDEDSFIIEIAHKKRKMRYLFMIIDQSICDVIALEISGPNYLRALFNYLFDFPLKKETNTKMVLTRRFKEALLRVFVCNSYAQGRKHGWKDSCNEYTSQLKEEIYLAFQRVENNDEICGCIDCLSHLGDIVGRILSDNFDYVLKEVFRGPESTFTPAHGLEERLKNGKLVGDCEKRQILHAYFELVRNNPGGVEFPGALYSLINKVRVRKRHGPSIYRETSVV